MSVAIIDGTIERAELGRSAKNVRSFKEIDIRDRLGTVHRLGRSQVTAEVGDQIVVGNSGRFYTFKNLDVKGVHGVRKDDGTAVYGHPAKNNMRLMAFIVPLLLVFIAFNIVWRDGVPLIALIALFFCGGAVIIAMTGMKEARAHFDGDTALRAAERT
jgi:hypothetical protein